MIAIAKRIENGAFPCYARFFTQPAEVTMESRFPEFPRRLSLLRAAHGARECSTPMRVDGPERRNGDTRSPLKADQNRMGIAQRCRYRAQYRLWYDDVDEGRRSVVVQITIRKYMVW